MRTLIALIALSLVVAACGGGSDEPAQPAQNHGFGWGHDVKSGAGINVRFDVDRGTVVGDPVSALGLQAVADFFDQQFASVVQCTGLSAPPPPYAVFVKDGSLGAQIAGRYYSDPPLILVTFAAAFRHEAVHYLLHQSTGDLDANHTSSFFSTCA